MLGLKHFGTFRGGQRLNLLLELSHWLGAGQKGGNFPRAAGAAPGSLEVPRPGWKFWLEHPGMVEGPEQDGL